MGKKATRREHFVPRFYLKGFSRDGKTLFTLPLAGPSGRAEVRHTCVRDVCVENRCYEVKSRDESFVQEGKVEEELSRLEGRLSKGLETLIASGSSKGPEAPDNVEELFSTAIVLVAHFLVRGKEWQGALRRRARRAALDLEGEGYFTEPAMEELSEYGLPDDAEAAAELAIVGASLFATETKAPMGALVGALEGMSMTIVRAPVGAEFVTGESPVRLMWDDRRGRLAGAYMPLCSSVAVWLDDRSPSHARTLLPVGAREVIRCNRWFAQGASEGEAVIASNERQLKALRSWYSRGR